MLGYRSFFRFRDEPNAQEILHGKLFQWLSSKSWDATKLVEGSAQQIAANVTGTLVHVGGDSGDDGGGDRDGVGGGDGARSSRFVFDQHQHSGTWTTTVTLHLDAGGESGWVWFDIDSPEGGPQPKPPRIAGELLRSVTGRDGDHVLTGQARIARRTRATEILQAIEDPRRRGLLFLAGTNDNLPLDKWANYVRGILRDTVGLASAHVLDAETTELVNSWLPATHRIAPGTVRTFRPGVDLDDPLDGVRHRYLTTDRIIRANRHALRGLLAHQARALSTSAPLPRDAADVDTRLRSRLDTALLEDATPPQNLTAATTGEGSLEAAVEVQVPPVSTDAPYPAGLADGPALSALSALTDVLRDLFGTTTVDAATVRSLGALAGRARTTAKAREDLQERMLRIEAERAEAHDEAELHRLLLEDEQLERVQAENERAEAERQLRHVRTELARIGEAEAAWSQPDDDPLDVRPESHDDLLRRFDELEYVEFTGDEDKTHDLDKHDPLGTWAGKSWDALLALNDYCRLTRNGEPTGGVHHYLMDTPGTCHGFPAGAHVPVESGTIQNDSKYSAPRTLPVPTGVAPSGTVFMGAHFRISRYGTISPRMHYYDDAAGTGKIYVGYIGPHLPNTRTN
ncbi:hypothetical protein [Tomitella fengzijianii]|uniref:Uncharacterized protein n=1 Tax=Tomitella fengzijianii TaxID=2597660 RepID=A0A516X1Z9_9ACTN|nr:hypothetical protein [Tomitella fengzijianii]QDQ97114.1 hypothetical protein FO059_06920 [Tomitella fengzijianii]